MLKASLISPHANRIGVGLPFSTSNMRQRGHIQHSAHTEIYLVRYQRPELPMMKEGLTFLQSTVVTKIMHFRRSPYETSMFSKLANALFDIKCLSDLTGIHIQVEPTTREV